MIAVTLTLLVSMACASSTTECPECVEQYAGFEKEMRSRDVPLDNPVVQESLHAACQAQEATDFPVDYVNDEEWNEANERYVDPVFDAHEFDGESKTIFATLLAVGRTVDGGAPMRAFCQAVDAK